MMVHLQELIEDREQQRHNQAELPAAKVKTKQQQGKNYEGQDGVKEEGLHLPTPVIAGLMKT